MVDNGIWVPYSGARWYAAGPAVDDRADSFVQVGEYHGFPVYRAKNGRTDDIYIAAVDGGPLTPYKKP